MRIQIIGPGTMAERDNQDIYGMKLHERIVFPNFTVDRVPGGWLYTSLIEHTYASHSGRETGSISATTTFVPYSEEFRK
ncbi:MAG: hypothetical protein A3J42_02395 [Candidatus Dadabacteria bacterium RIFCSPHIGHO2_12_FULL_53_21]|nr:MAG: hypothetical protein A3J42_02395 [Candidatus Dadabacteria bacterium RIFCSPHIGHO2_12_FULL_53_21]